MDQGGGKQGLGGKDNYRSRKYAYLRKKTSYHVTVQDELERRKSNNQESIQVDAWRAAADGGQGEAGDVLGRSCCRSVQGGVEAKRRDIFGDGVIICDEKCRR